MESTLTTTEQQELIHHEGIIERGLTTFVDVGNALATIRDNRLHKATHSTFENYCRERWKMAHRTAYQFIGASAVVENVRHGAQILPANERQARPLTRLEPEQQREAWKKAVETAPQGIVTSAHVKAIVIDMTREPEPQVMTLPAPRSPRLIVGQAEDLPELKSESIDLIITSPPYNLGQANWPMGGDGRVPRNDGIGYQDHLNELAYQEWQFDILREMYRIAKPGASFFYNHKVRNSGGAIIHPLYWLNTEFNPWAIRQEIIWDRGSTHNHSPTLFWPHDERIYWMTKGPPTLPNRPIGLPTIWRFHGPVAGTWHPAPFSEELPRKCIEAVGREGITVLDPFAGSCTTLKVALEYPVVREAIGVDIEQEYLIEAARENGWTLTSNNSKDR